MSNELEILRKFFSEHPTWIKAASPVREGANSEVFIAGQPRPYHLYRTAGRSELREGPAPSPDFSLMFSYGAVKSFHELKDGEIADFAILLFDCIKEEDIEQKIGFRVVGTLSQVLGRGYLQVLLKGGPRVLQYAAAHGVRSIGDFSRLLRGLRGKDVNWTDFQLL